ncbi:SulP family inorganic anion transporter [Aestuariibius sp. 2305UL40-4]|uniref:SulP family inorganic anion transporter n=1 Tax=Aestuariibius violaceus TaxID=3234132 RepID=UPI00345E2607
MTDYLPLWTKGYSAKSFGSDALAGAILAILLIPQAMAYALLAGLPPQMGLYTAIIPPLLYALLGQSAFVSVGPVALASLLVADAIGQSDLPPPEAAAIIAIEVGIVLLLLGIFRLGRLVNFVSEPALLGFTAGAAILIAVSQIPPFLGLDVPRSGTLPGAVQALWSAGAIHLPTVLIGAAVLASLLLADRYCAAGLWRLGIRPPFRLALVKSVPLLVISVAAFAALYAPDVATVDAPEGQVFTLTLPPLDPAPWLSLLGSSAVIAVIVFVTGTAVAKSLSSRRRRPLDTDREALAVGAANVAAGFTGGYAAGVSLSRSALVFDTGARSPLATAVAGAIVVPVMLFGGPALSMLPATALAALVISAVFGLVKVTEIKAVWQHRKVEGGVIAVAFLATILLGVQWGLVAGAAAGVLTFLWFSSLPRVTRVGAADGEDDVFRSTDRDEVTEDTTPVIVIRIDRSIYFGNVGHCETQILDILAQAKDAECLVLDMRAVNEVDASGVRMINRLFNNLEEKDLKVGFAALHEPVKDAICSSAKARMAPHFTTVKEGLEEMRALCGADQRSG